MKKKLTMQPGETVWAVERDEDLVPVEVAGFLLLAQLQGYVIAAAEPYGYDDLWDQLCYFAEETRRGLNEELMVFPAADCYATQEEAEAALEKEVEENE